MMHRVRVCFVSLGAYALFEPRIPGAFGGAEVQLYLLATGLAGDPAFDVHFVTGDYGQPALEMRDGVAVHRGIPIGAAPLPVRAVRWGLQLTTVIARTGADVLVQRTAGAETGLFRLVTRAFGRKMLYMVAHQIDCDGEYERQNGPLHGRLYRYGLRRADLVVAQSEDQRRLLRLHHGRDSVVMPTMHEIPDESGLFGEPRDHVLWVGRCEDWKRPELFIELARRFPDERFLMIAPAALAQPVRYEAIRQEASTVPNLRHLPFVPFHEIDGYFRRAKLLVQTSTQEGFPNTFVQAAKHGVPAVSLQVNPDGFLERHDCGACAGGSVERLAELVGALLRDPALRERQAKNGWRYARGHHDRGRIVERYKALFRGLVGVTGEAGHRSVSVK